MHPKFVASLYEQDIALLHLDEDLVFSSSVLPVCLPPPGAGRTVMSCQFKKEHHALKTVLRHREISLPWAPRHIDGVGKTLG